MSCKKYNIPDFSATLSTCRVFFTKVMRIWAGHQAVYTGLFEQVPSNELDG
jgi:hypothetical protein